jgi:hypothetical protein
MPSPRDEAHVPKPVPPPVEATISGIGQTLAAQDLCQTLPHSMKANYLQEKVGHYGVFNGSRFRNDIVPRIREFHSWISRPVHALKLVATAETKCAKGGPNNVQAGLTSRRRKASWPYNLRSRTHPSFRSTSADVR